MAKIIAKVELTTKNFDEDVKRRFLCSLNNSHKLNVQWWDDGYETWTEAWIDDDPDFEKFMGHLTPESVLVEMAA